MHVLNCDSCGGLAFHLYSCECRRDGDKAMPEPGCQLCRGSGIFTLPCLRCRRTGRRRAQLVLTVVNVDTGAVASADVVPGTLRPHPVSGQWRVDLMALVRDLAASVDAVTFHEISSPGRPVRPVDELSMYLPVEWQPDLPVARRRSVEAAAIAGFHRSPWLIYLGQSTADRPPTPDQRLAELCGLADRLCLDLVVEARRMPRTTSEPGRLDWDVRYELPGMTAATRIDRHGELPTAVAATQPRKALYRLFGSDSPAPAHWIQPPKATDPPTIDADQVERRLVALCTGGFDDIGTVAAGAQAIWREGRWYYCGLRAAGQTDDGAVGYARAYEPAAPSYLGDRIPPSEGVALTITGLSGKATHVNWPANLDRSAHPVGAQPNGRPVVQLAEGFRLARWAPPFGVRPEHLFDARSDYPIEQDLREGVATLTCPDADPIDEYLRRASAGRPGARLLVVAAPPDAPPLSHVVRLAFGLGFAVEAAVCNHRLDADDPCKIHGERWRVDIVSAESPIAPSDVPLKDSLEQAIAYCWENLDQAVDAATPRDPTRALPVPQQRALPDDDDADQVAALLSRMGDRHAGEVVALRLARDGCRLYLGEEPTLLVDAPTLGDIFTKLGMQRGI
jgi:hypothetical protein